jgi:glutamate-5-semialdehyde dehydrogenase
VARLDLRKGKFETALDMVRSVATQPDPLWQTQRATELDDGLELFRVTVPIGVIGVIFESRPDALVQIAALCLKSGNAVLLKGGSEAAHSNRILADVIVRATEAVEGIPAGWLTLLETRGDVTEILGMEDAIDLIIPRGSKDFAAYVMANTKIPVTGHTDGVCHVYVDAAADFDKALRVAIDSKIQDVSTCCAEETLLVHADMAEGFLQRAIKDLGEAKVLIRGDDRVRALPGVNGQVEAATEEDWSAEYLDYVLSVKIVDSLEEAIDHINRFGSAHTDTIVTQDKAAATRFLQGVDSASVFVNASTRFADGYRYGLGAEIGISTGRLHSRGPVGLEGLTTYKYLLEGSGQIVDDYSGSDARPYTHKLLDRQWTRVS